MHVWISPQTTLLYLASVIDYRSAQHDVLCYMLPLIHVTAVAVAAAVLCACPVERDYSLRCWILAAVQSTVTDVISQISRQSLSLCLSVCLSVCLCVYVCVCNNRTKWFKDSSWNRTFCMLDISTMLCQNCVSDISSFLQQRPKRDFKQFSFVLLFGK